MNKGKGKTGPLPRQGPTHVPKTWNVPQNINDDMFPRNSKGDRIKHVITNMTVNHDPNGVVSFHSNGAPVQTNMSLTFQETEFVTSKDAVDDRYESAVNQNITRQAQATQRRLEREAVLRGGVSGGSAGGFDQAR